MHIHSFSISATGNITLGHMVAYGTESVHTSTGWIVYIETNYADTLLTADQWNGTNVERDDCGCMGVQRAI